MAFPAVGAEAEDLGGANCLNSFPEEKSPTEKASPKTDLEVNSKSVFDYR